MVEQAFMKLATVAGLREWVTNLQNFGKNRYNPFGIVPVDINCGNIVAIESQPGESPDSENAGVPEIAMVDLDLR